MLRTLQKKVLARAITGGVMHDSILSAIDWLEGWADRPYEGQSVTAALGFDAQARGADLTLEELFSLQFSAVLSNGVDTMVCVDAQGRVVGHECLDRAEDAAVVRALPSGSLRCLGRRRPRGARPYAQERHPHLQGQSVAVREALGPLAFSDPPADRHADACSSLDRRPPGRLRKLLGRLVRPPRGLYRRGDEGLRHPLGGSGRPRRPPRSPGIRRSPSLSATEAA